MAPCTGTPLWHWHRILIIRRQVCLRKMDRIYRQKSSRMVEIKGHSFGVQSQPRSQALESSFRTVLSQCAQESVALHPTLSKIHPTQSQESHVFSVDSSRVLNQHFQQDRLTAGQLLCGCFKIRNDRIKSTLILKTSQKNPSPHTWSKMENLSLSPWQSCILAAWFQTLSTKELKPLFQMNAVFTLAHWPIEVRTGFSLLLTVLVLNLDFTWLASHPNQVRSKRAVFSAGSALPTASQRQYGSEVPSSQSASLNPRAETHLTLAAGTLM